MRKVVEELYVFVEALLRRDDIRVGVSVFGRPTGTAELDELRSQQVPGSTSTGARVVVTSSEDGHRGFARFVSAKAWTHEPESAPVVLPDGVPIPGKEHSLARWKRPQDEIGE